MDWTVVIVLAAIALATLITGLVLSGRQKDEEIAPPFPLRSAVRSLPISPYTGEEYDPAWGTALQQGSDPFGIKRIDRNKSLPLIDPHVPPFPERPSLQQKLLSRPPNPLLIGMDGELVPRGQSNRALLKLMKTIEEEIEERSEPPQSVSGIIPYGQAVGDFPDPEAEYDERQFAPSDWKPER